MANESLYRQPLLHGTFRGNAAHQLRVRDPFALPDATLLDKALVRGSGLGLTVSLKFGCGVSTGRLLVNVCPASLLSSRAPITCSRFTCAKGIQTWHAPDVAHPRAMSFMRDEHEKSEAREPRISLQYRTCGAWPRVSLVCRLIGVLSFVGPPAST